MKRYSDVLMKMRCCASMACASRVLWCQLSRQESSHHARAVNAEHSAQTAHLRPTGVTRRSCERRRPVLASSWRQHLAATRPFERPRIPRPHSSFVVRAHVLAAIAALKRLLQGRRRRRRSLCQVRIKDATILTRGRRARSALSPANRSARHERRSLELGLGHGGNPQQPPQGGWRSSSKTNNKRPTRRRPGASSRTSSGTSPATRPTKTANKIGPARPSGRKNSGNSEKSRKSSRTERDRCGRSNRGSRASPRRRWSGFDGSQGRRRRRLGDARGVTALAPRVWLSRGADADRSSASSGYDFLEGQGL